MHPSSAPSVRSSVVKAYDIRGVVPDELDADLVRTVGRTFATLASPEGGPSGEVVVGRDARVSSPALAAAFIEGVTSTGVGVVDLGLASTDLVYYASGSLGRAGAMITASHNPARYNGIKLCGPGAVPMSRDGGLAMIAHAVDAGTSEGTAASKDAARRGPVVSRNLLPEFVAYLHRLVPLEGIRGLRVVVDAGNGMAGLTVPAVLAGTRVGLDGLYLDLDGTFPNHPADPLDPATLVDLQRRVRTSGADLGLAFDGDADRCFVVDETGAAVSPSAITALIAERELTRLPGASIIHNLISSRAVPEAIRAAGGVPVRTRVGHSFIKATMASTGAVFGGEHSGHYYFADFWRADSGLLAAMHVLAALGAAPEGTTLSDLVRRFERYSRSGEINSVVARPDAVLTAAREAYRTRAGAEVDDLDGVTVSTEDWWFNLRASNTEPLLRLNVEACDDATMHRVRDDVLAFVAARSADV